MLDHSRIRFLCTLAGFIVTAIVYDGNFVPSVNEISDHPSDDSLFVIGSDDHKEVARFVE